MKNNSVLTWKIGGVAGGGQQVAGLIFAKACTRGGLYTFDSSEYPSLIRGGLVTYRLSISEKPVTAIYQSTQLLIALTQAAYQYCIKGMIRGGAILYDSDKFTVGKTKINHVKTYPLPLKKLVAEADIKPVAANMIAIGASIALLGYDLDIVKTTITEIFQKKGQSVVLMNIKAVEHGYYYASANFDVDKFPYKISVKSKSQTKKILVTANDTISLGAIAAGCQYFVAYPMTPASSILHNLAAWAEKTNMLVVQPEDEISGIHMAIGAAYAGVRSMTATSGGGFALMNEGLAMSGITETPLVLVEAIRPGPATGLPTWTGQGDLAYVVNAGHGEFIRVVLAPGDAQEAFELTGLAFNLAEKYQIPVIILVDKHISEGHQSIEPIRNNLTIERGRLLTQAELLKIKKYKRYIQTKSGISPRSIPGQRNGIHITNSDEHDEYGFSIEGFSPLEAEKQMEKRLSKLDSIMSELPKPRLYGSAKAKLTLIGWGSTKGPVLAALNNLPQVNYLHVTAPWPLSEKLMLSALKGVKRLVAIENTATSQFARLLRAQTGVKATDNILKYNGSHFFPEEIINRVSALLKNK